jgi:large subunit ribosomal protein L4
MTYIDVYNLQKEKVSELELKENIFAVPVKRHVLHQVVVAQLASKRSGSASTKSRSEVKSSGSKLWRQKGTGRARVGSASSPIRRGGGVAFGPRQRKYDLKVPKKVRKSALRMALTDKAVNKQLVVVDNFDGLTKIKTKLFLEIMHRFELNQTLIVTKGKKEVLEKSSRNISRVKVLQSQGLNVYDVIRHDSLMLEQDVLRELEEALIV